MLRASIKSTLMSSCADIPCMAVCKRNGRKTKEGISAYDDIIVIEPTIL